MLKGLGVKKGDRVTLYMPMVLELSIAMLACARIGAMHSVVFAGFSPEALAGRMDDGHWYWLDQDSWPPRAWDYEDQEWEELNP